MRERPCGPRGRGAALGLRTHARVPREERPHLLDLRRDERALHALALCARRQVLGEASLHARVDDARLGRRADHVGQGNCQARARTVRRGEVR